MEPDTGIPEIVIHNGTTPWWQNWKWIASVAFALFVVMVGGITILTFQAQRDSSKTLKKANQAVEIAQAAVTLQEQNNRILERLDVSQADLDELLAFVHQLQESMANPQEGQSTKDFFTILCANPVYAEVCARLGRP